LRARIVDPMAPNFAAFRRVSANAERERVDEVALGDVGIRPLDQ
jgi:hypothetical protein